MEHDHGECKFGAHAEEELAMPRNMDCEGDGGVDGERARLLSKLRTPSNAEWRRHVVSDVVSLKMPLKTP